MDELTVLIDTVNRLVEFIARKGGNKRQKPCNASIAGLFVKYDAGVNLRGAPAVLSVWRDVHWSVVLCAARLSSWI
jgi:hypothetical protein